MSMWRKFLPRRFKRVLKGQLLRLTTSPLLFYTLPFLPSHRSATTYSLTASHSPLSTPNADSANLAVPPSQFWAGYGTTADDYLASGQRDVTILKALLTQAACPLLPGECILDFGCAAGRILRW